jgi:hypothetical protein
VGGGGERKRLGGREGGKERAAWIPFQLTGDGPHLTHGDTHSSLLKSSVSCWGQVH